MKTIYGTITVDNKMIPFTTRAVFRAYRQSLVDAGIAFHFSINSISPDIPKNETVCNGHFDGRSYDRFK